MYNVAFVGTSDAGGYEGVVTWTTYKSKEDFDKSMSEWPEESRKKLRVLEEGISQERCIELCDGTPLASRIAASLQDATGPDGNINRRLLQRRLEQVVAVSLRT